MKNTSVTIIAGPCSISEDNQEQLFDIAQITISTPSRGVHQPIWGLRVVGLKSRTSLDLSGNGMGIDFPVYQRNIDRFMKGESHDTFEVPPSVRVAEKIFQKTNMLVATEVVDPMIQIPPFVGIAPAKRLLLWNPAVNQLGHPMFTMGQYAIKNNWYVGIKNGKWLGDIPNSGMSSMEKCWAGLSTYAMGGDLTSNNHLLAMIHRGVDVANKGEYRNLPVHDAAQRIKENVSVKLFFDPSHSFGPLLRDSIVDETVKALGLKTKDDEYLYDGLLIEVGESVTDTGQHITIPELTELCQRISEFRDIQSPNIQ